jgi:aminoglycoside phosphotransferase
VLFRSLNKNEIVSNQNNQMPGPGINQFIPTGTYSTQNPMQQNNNQITMENIEGVSLSYLYTNKLLKTEQLINLTTQLRQLHEYETKVDKYPKVYADYNQKLRDRYYNNLELYNKYIHAKSIFKKLDNLLFYYDDAIFSVIHGDPVFTNVLQTEQGL